ncbi:hypothetical protein BO85DRAFT_154916 [Aspergillus piperis CBS 112811]|uniref:Uncharacterized protein n=1 Tax=Aspergillus piperis CBS 112811 TaxID=1448313 RepID=A0A8G1QVG1_9EURO|nr:hypothetical protein BO85DRAFT_154916 [Aspergillus piperis CBS 112811]RAH53592.1 hypothetical protein BO85DRAFT_154916 [Aspergillus piperis CBS 112811]
MGLCKERAICLDGYLQIETRILLALTTGSSPVDLAASDVFHRHPRRKNPVIPLPQQEFPTPLLVSFAFDVFTTDPNGLRIARAGRPCGDKQVTHLLDRAPRSSGLRRRARSGQWPSRFWPSTESSPCPSGLDSVILYLLIWPRPRWSTESLPCLFVTPLPRADPLS